MNATVLNPSQDYPTLSLIGVAHGTSHFFHFLLPSLYPWLMRDFGLSFTQAGALMSTFFLVSGLGQALAGLVVDRVGATRVLFGGLSLLASAAVTLGLASSYGALLAGAALAGLGNSVFHPADYTILNRRVSPSRLGQAFSVHGLAGNGGWVACPPFIAVLGSAFGWRVACCAAAVVAVLCIGVLATFRGLVEVTPARRSPTAHSGTGTGTGTSTGSGTGTGATAEVGVATRTVLLLPAVWL